MASSLNYSIEQILSSSEFSSITPTPTGILIVSYSNQSGTDHKWSYDNDDDIIQQDLPPTISLENGFFISRNPGGAKTNSIFLDHDGSPSISDTIKFYIVVSDSGLTDYQSYNPQEVKNNLYQSKYYGFDGTTDVGTDPLTQYDANFVVPPPPSITPIYTYTPEQIKTLYDYNIASLTINQTKNETIASEVKSFLDTNNYLPQFKNYMDYLSYKKSLSAQNFLLNKYK
jgi:hypothetical protein